MKDNLYYLLALNRIAGIGPRTVANCLRKWPNLGDMFRLSPQDLVDVGFSEHKASLITRFDFRELEADLQWQEASNHKLLSWLDKGYPPLLKQIDDPPIILYAQGDLSCLNQATIAIVGTRKPSITGRENAWQFGFDLADAGMTVVSGLALGVDAQAHLGALGAHGKTIAVMGTGIDSIYPRNHVNLAKKITENGLLLTEFPLKSLPIAGHFPRRNRIISGLSLATLVIEAAVRSGSLITARLALEQNRDVLAIPSSIHNPQARGCHQLLQQGAKLITSCQDILDEMNLDNYYSKKVLLNKTIACENNNLMEYIGFEVTHVDQIIQRSGLSVHDAICALAELEIKGIVTAVPGGYMRC